MNLEKKKEEFNLRIPHYTNDEIDWDEVWQWLEETIKEVKESLEKEKLSRIEDIVVSNEDGDIYWISGDDVSTLEEAYKTFVEYFYINDDSDTLDRFKLHDINEIRGYWKRSKPDDGYDDDYDRWIEDEEKGEVWYRLDI